MGASEAERVLDEFVREPPPSQQDQVRSVYQPVEVYDRAGRPWPGTILAWRVGPDGVKSCHLRLTGAGAPRWTAFDPERMVPLVQGGT